MYKITSTELRRWDKAIVELLQTSLIAKPGARKKAIDKAVKAHRELDKLIYPQKYGT
jgi:hypothetical protein